MKQLFSLQKIPVSICIAFFTVTATAGDPYYMPAGASQSGMGYISVTKTGFWPSFHNQALLFLNQSPAAGFCYENRFGIPEMGTCSAGIIIPAGKATLSSGYSRFGYADFRRNMTSLGCGLQLSEKILSGIQIDYLSEKTYGEYNDIHLLTFETGILVKAGEEIRIGVHLYNPVPGRLRKNDLLSAITAGIGGNISPNLYTGAEIEMISGGRIDLRTGFEYGSSEKLKLRGGYRTLNSSFSFGIGYIAGPALIDIGFASHEKLGITSSISLIFKIR